LKKFLVEALFDYQPVKWYQIDTQPPNPPSRDTLSEEPRSILKRISKLSRDQKLSDKDLFF
jgi:hypothetical protein